MRGEGGDLERRGRELGAGDRKQELEEAWKKVEGMAQTKGCREGEMKKESRKRRGREKLENVSAEPLLCRRANPNDREYRGPESLLKSLHSPKAQRRKTTKETMKQSE